MSHTGLHVLAAVGALILLSTVGFVVGLVIVRVAPWPTRSVHRLVVSPATIRRLSRADAARRVAETRPATRPPRPARAVPPRA